MIRPIVLVALSLATGCKQGGSPSPESSASPAMAAATLGTAVPGAPTATASVPTVAGPSVQAARSPTAAENSPGVWNFDADKTEAPPSGFSFGRTGGGRQGRWLVVAASDAPSKPNVLAQLDADTTDYRFPLAVVDSSSFKDVRLSVSCKPVSGSVDQGCGLVWRFKDADNYCLTRANALEDNVNLYHVKGGSRIQFKGWNGQVATKAWHKLRVDARGDRFEVYFDEKKVIEANDSTFSDAGKIGVWTKADSVMQFDDLTATAL